MGIQKNAVVKANRFSTNGILQDMEIKYFEGAEWAKIFEHNNHGGTVLFTSIAEALHSETIDKYSRLYLLDSLENVNGKYEFLLQYPDDEYYNEKYNRWIQKNNPCNEYVTTTSTGEAFAEGYEAVHIDWTARYWGGLTRQQPLTSTSINPTYLSGSVGHSNWYYAIGCSSSWSGGIPAENYANTGRAQLWIRIDNLPEETKCQIAKFCIVANDFYEI